MIPTAADGGIWPAAGASRTEQCISDAAPFQGVTRRLPRTCRACGTWCGSAFTLDGLCPLLNRNGCILRHDRRFRFQASPEGGTA